MPIKPTLDFVYFDAGGGHRSAALALQSVIQAGDLNWDVRLMNLQEVLDPLDVFRKLTGIRLEDLYNLALAKGWTLGSTYLLPMMHGVIRAYHSSQVKLLTEYWEQRTPDMVVSLVPNFNRAMFQSLQAAAPHVPYVTILTDLVDYPPHFWMEKQTQYFICPTARAMQQALAMGHARSKVFEVSGVILRPQFYSPPRMDRQEGRRELGLKPGLPTGLVLFGGQGSNTMSSIAGRLGNSSEDMQLIMVCGHNERLKSRLKNMKTRNRLAIEGFTKDIPHLMHLCDFFIGKPGPGSISESLRMNLPVIVERNSWTLPQERYNADWILEQGVGVVLDNFRTIENAVRRLLQEGTLTRMRRKTEAINNRAVFEIPLILEKILHAGTSGQA